MKSIPRLTRESDDKIADVEKRAIGVNGGDSYRKTEELLAEPLERLLLGNIEGFETGGIFPDDEVRTFIVRSRICERLEWPNKRTLPGLRGGREFERLLSLWGKVITCD